MKTKTLIKRIPNPIQKPLFKELVGIFRRHRVLDLRRCIEQKPKHSMERDFWYELRWHIGRLNKALAAASNFRERRKIERNYEIRFFLNRHHFTHNGSTLVIPHFQIKTPLVLKSNQVIKRIWFNADKLFIELVIASKHERTKHLSLAKYEARTAAWAAAQEIANGPGPTPDLGPNLSQGASEHQRTPPPLSWNVA